MAVQAREKFATQVNSEIPNIGGNQNAPKRLQLQVLFDEALADLIEKRKQNRPRANVMAVYQASHEKFGPLYKKLAE